MTDAAERPVWLVEHLRGDVGEFHERRPTDAEGPRVVWVFEPAVPTLVLGSNQRPEAIDEAACRAHGVQVVRRRSGGGAVLVIPGEMVWIDVVVWREDPLWSADVGRSMHWVGDAWIEALQPLLDARVRAERTLGIHRGPLVSDVGAAEVCFAARGAGEVVLDGTQGSKLVGISQRRTARWARFQTMCHLRWQPRLMGELLAQPPELDHLSRLVTAVEGVDGATLSGAVLAAITRR